MILYVSALATSTCTGGGGGTLAYASNCQRDQNDRPIFGFINFCPAHVNADPLTLVAQLSTAVHEVFHAMGFGGGGGVR
jgi:leishmanolysin-like peptidase